MKPYELTDEEKEVALSGIPACDGKNDQLKHRHAADKIAHAAQRKLLEYLWETCYIHKDLNDASFIITLRYGCRLCMQALLKDFGL